MQRYTRTYRKNDEKFTPRSVRKIEHQARNKLIFTIIASVAMVIILVTWGLPALINGLAFLTGQKAQPGNGVPQNESVAIAPPALTIPFDATNSASIKISGYTTPDTTVQIYFDDQLKDTEPVGSDGSFVTKDLSLVLGVNNIYGKTVDSQGHTSLPSKTIQLTYNNEKPSLTVSSPNDGTLINGGDKKVAVTGTTDPSDNISVNGITVVVGNDGSFSTETPLNDGDNTITVTATDPVGNTTTIQRKVTFNDTGSPSPSPTSTP